MAFTFASAKRVNPVGGAYTLSATTDTSSAAGSFVVPFSPAFVQVFDTTNTQTFSWVYGMADASMWKQTVNTLSRATTNGISISEPTDATPAQFTVTLGTGIHTNSSSFLIVVGA